jgi:hypothetical protein
MPIHSNACPHFLLANALFKVELFEEESFKVQAGGMKATRGGHVCDDGVLSK